MKAGAFGPGTSHWPQFFGPTKVCNFKAAYRKQRSPPGIGIAIERPSQ
jgi:hypothetical protein